LTFILGRHGAAGQNSVRIPATSDSAVASDSSWRSALLHYNGCVRGKNTRNCSSYPVTVQKNVIENAKTTCNGQDFDACVVRPLWLSTRSDP
jgi:hypothetical protein